MNAPTENIHYLIVPVQTGNDYQIVELHGEMDKAGLKTVKDDLLDYVEHFPFGYLVIDLTNLEFINSEGVGFLMTLYSHLVKIKKNLVLIGAKSQVKDVLSIIGILNFIPYHDLIEDFLRKLSH